MDARRLTLTLEVETDAPLEALQRAANMNLEVLSKGDVYACEVIQAEANVIQRKPATAAPARKKKPSRKK